MEFVRGEPTRGLLLKPEWAELFAKGDKCMDIRSHNVRCVRPDETVFIVASGQGKNAHGVTVLQILGRMKFVKATLIEQSEFDNQFDSHRVPTAVIQQMLASWGKTGKEVKLHGWQFKDISRLETPAWIKWNNDTRQNLVAVVDVVVVVVVVVVVECVVECMRVFLFYHFDDGNVAAAMFRFPASWILCQSWASFSVRQRDWNLTPPPTSILRFTVTAIM